MNLETGDRNGRSIVAKRDSVHLTQAKEYQSELQLNLMDSIEFFEDCKVQPVEIV